MALARPIRGAEDVSWRTKAGSTLVVLMKPMPETKVAYSAANAAKFQR
jgi:hypothetical protein